MDVDWAAVHRRARAAEKRAAPKPRGRPRRADEMLWPTLKAFAALGLPVPDHPLYDYDLVLTEEDEDARS